MQKATSITSDPIKPIHGSLEQTFFKHQNYVFVTQSQIGNPCTFHYRREGWCPICGRTVIFASNHSWLRDHYLCSGCGSIPRERATMHAIQTYYPNWRELSIHESSPCGRGTSVKLAKECKNYTASQYDPELEFGNIHPSKGYRSENLENQTFPNESFDLVVTQDVMEHVFDPVAAFREIHRTLKPGGAHIFTTPLVNGSKPSQRCAELLPDGSVRHVHPPEYHGNPVSKDGSLVTWHWGEDILNFCGEKIGAESSIHCPVHDPAMGIEGEFCEVVCAKKPQFPIEECILKKMHTRAAAPFKISHEPKNEMNFNTDLLNSLGDTYNVNPVLHCEDMILQFLLGHPCFKTQHDAVSQYFSSGKRSASQLKEILDYLEPTQTPRRILEFASGYGCVTRHLPGVLPKSEIVCSDIHPQAMEFISQNFAIKHCELSATNPDDFKCPRGFDVVFALSFFSHMPARTWKKWLERLFGILEPGGLLIFTTHGHYSKKHLGNPVIPPEGFWFKESSEQKDLSVADYGQTIVTLEFVYNAIRGILDSKLALFREAYWWEHQDLYVVRRDN